MFGVIGGVEVIGAPLVWSDPDAKRFAVYTRPYAGMQLNGSVMSLRCIFSPLIMGTVWGDGEWITGSVLADSLLINLHCCSIIPNRQIMHSGEAIVLDPERMD